MPSKRRAFLTFGKPRCSIFSSPPKASTVSVTEVGEERKTLQTPSEIENLPPKDKSETVVSKAADNSPAFEFFFDRAISAGQTNAQALLDNEIKISPEEVAELFERIKTAVKVARDGAAESRVKESDFLNPWSDGE
jgi:hypothetical protein